MFRKIKGFVPLATTFPLYVLSRQEPMREIRDCIPSGDKVTVQFRSEIVGLAASTIALIALAGS